MYDYHICIYFSSFKQTLAQIYDIYSEQFTIYPHISYTVEKRTSSPHSQIAGEPLTSHIHYNILCSYKQKLSNDVLL